MKKPQANVNRWTALKLSGVLKYSIFTVFLIAASVAASLNTCKWSWISQAGGVIVLFGVLLSFRRLFRLGASGVDSPVEPFVINGNQFNINAVFQDIQRITDNYAQKFGVVFMVAGTLMGSYGDSILSFLFPFAANQCT